ncbi:MAG: hypothetical protein KDD34_03585, partial [Bdellovibrionales bacterium]|nr:hypothetical protein [Bdellovibrionales bacterium]
MTTKDQLAVFRYRNATIFFYRFFIGLLILACLIIIRYRLAEVLEEETLLAIGKLILACSVPLSLLVRIFFVFRPRILATYELYEDHLVRIFRKKRYVISFQEIKEIRLSFLSPRFLGGFSLLTQNGQKLQFLSALKNSHIILKEIIKSRVDLLDEKRFQKYLQSSQFVDVSWQRIREKLKEWKLIGVKFLAIPAVIFLVVLWIPFSWLRYPVKLVEFLYLFTVIFLIILVIGFIMNSIEERLALSRCHWDNDE